MPTYGPNSPGAISNESIGAAASFTTSLGDIQTSDNNKISVNIGGSANTNRSRTSTYGFAIGTGETIDGILVEIEKGSGEAKIRDHQIRIVKGGTTGSTDLGTLTLWPVADAYVSHGGASTLWGETWGETDIESSGFGVAIAAYNTDPGTVNATIDHVRITVYTSAAASGAAPFIRRRQPRALRRM